MINGECFFTKNAIKIIITLVAASVMKNAHLDTVIKVPSAEKDLLMEEEPDMVGKLETQQET